MVCTVTLDPALDYLIQVDALIPGTVRRVREAKLRPGGKGINVSAVLTALGIANTALGFRAGASGRMLDEALTAAGLRTRLMPLDSGATRINVKIRGREETALDAAGPPIPPEALAVLLAELDRLGEGDVLVLSGSVPPSLPPDIYRRILERLGDRGIRAVVDTSGEALRLALCRHPFLIKPNQPELEALTGGPVRDEADLCARAAALQTAGARNVLVSLGREGALLLDEGGGRRRAQVPPGALQSSVGAGDAMVAGFLAGWLRTGDYPHALRWGVAAGSAAAYAGAPPAKAQVEALLAEIVLTDLWKG